MIIKPMTNKYLYIILLLQFIIVLCIIFKPFRTSYDTYNTNVSTTIDISNNTYNYFYKIDSVKIDGTMIKK
jgi:hypothetical protein